MPPSSSSPEGSTGAEREDLGGIPRFSGFWFLYLGGMGIFFPFISLYLAEGLGFRPGQVGMLLAVVPLAGVLTQPFWGYLADRTGSRRGVLFLLSSGAASGAFLLSGLHSFVAVLLGIALFAAFHASVLPMATSVTLAHGGADVFGGVRMWGTVGFLVSVVSFPFLDRRLGAFLGREGELGSLFPAVAVMCLGAACLALALPRSRGLALKADPGEARRLLGRGPFVRLLILVWVTHSLIQGPIYLFPLFLSSRGGDATLLSRVWILMLLLEIPLIALSSRTSRRLGPRGLLRLGLTTEALRWTACALTSELWVIVAVQVLHGVGVAGILVGGPLYAERVVPRQLRSTGQALVSMAGPSAGAIASNVAAGWLMESVGMEAPYLLAGLGAGVLALTTRLWLPAPSDVQPAAGGRIAAGP